MVSKVMIVASVGTQYRIATATGLYTSVIPVNLAVIDFIVRGSYSVRGSVTEYLVEDHAKRRQQYLGLQHFLQDIQTVLEDVTHLAANEGINAVLL